MAAVGTWLIYRVTVGVARRFTGNGFRWGQIGSASLVSLARGTNDAQKTMGVITLALIASGDWSAAAGPRATVAGTVLGWLLILVVLAGVALGITFVVASGFGKVMSFEHIFPTIHAK